MRYDFRGLMDMFHLTYPELGEILIEYIRTQSIARVPSLYDFIDQRVNPGNWVR